MRSLPSTLLLASSSLAMQHSAMWGLNDASAAAGWGTLTFDVSDNATVTANFRAGIRALIPLTWTTTQKEKCFAPVPHTQTTKSGYFTCTTIDPDYEALWKKQWAAIKPLAASGAAIGVFLGDEHMWFGVKLAEVKLIADLIRRDWPSAIIFQNEAPDIVMCNYRKDNTSVWAPNECLPVNIDWFGFDFYAMNSLSWEGPIDANHNYMIPRMSRADQRLAPTSLGYDGRQNVSAEEVALLDDFCAKNALKFFEYGLRERRVVGQFPFHYNGGVRHPDGSVTGGIGVENLPNCLRTYQGIGKIISAMPAGTSGDLAHVPPQPNAEGKFIEPKCPTQFAPPPSYWAFCKRT